MAGQEYPADVVIAQQLAKAVSRQMDPLCTLVGRLFMRLPAQVVIAHLPVALTAVLRGTSDERIQIIGYSIFKEHSLSATSYCRRKSAIFLE